MRARLFFVALVLVVLLGSSISAETIETGGDLRIGIGTDPESFDPIRISSAPAGMVFEHMVEALFDMDEEGEIYPLLAKDYDVSDDGLIWTIYLREGIEFHDGVTFNADAVKFNLERFLDPEKEAPYRFLIDKVTEVEVVDDYTVRLHTEEVFAPIIAHLSHRFIGMVSPEAVEEYGEDVGENPVGTGPFMFQRWVRGESVELEKNPDYWGEGPYLDSVEFKIIPEDGTRMIMVETGEIHAAMRVPPRDMPRLADHPEVNVLRVPSVRTIYIGFHNQRPPLDDIRVRRALNYAVDKEVIVEHILAGAGQPSDAPISPGIFGYTPVGQYEYNPEKAQELLEEAGYPDGFDITLYHPVGRYLMDETIVEGVQAQFAEIGVDAELITMEWAAYLEFLRKSPEEAEHDMYFLGWGCVTMDADYGLYPMFHSSQMAPAGWDLSYVDNPEIDSLLDLARVEPDVDERMDIYEEAMNLIFEEAPWLFLHNELQLNAVRDNVHGLIHHPRESILALEAWIED